MNTIELNTHHLTLINGATPDGSSVVLGDILYGHYDDGNGNGGKAGMVIIPERPRTLNPDEQRRQSHWKNGCLGCATCGVASATVEGKRVEVDVLFDVSHIKSRPWTLQILKAQFHNSPSLSFMLATANAMHDMAAVSGLSGGDGRPWGQRPMRGLHRELRLLLAELCLRGALGVAPPDRSLIEDRCIDAVEDAADIMSRIASRRQRTLADLRGGE